MVDDASRKGDLATETAKPESAPAAIPVKRKLAVAKSDPANLPAEEKNKVVHIIRRLEEETTKHRTAKRSPWLSTSIVAAIALPTLIAALFYLFIASDRFVSEARFAVRNNEAQVADALGMITGMPSSHRRVGFLHRRRLRQEPRHGGRSSRSGCRFAGHLFRPGGRLLLPARSPTVYARGARRLLGEPHRRLSTIPPRTPSPWRCRRSAPNDAQRLARGDRGDRARSGQFAVRPGAAATPCSSPLASWRAPSSGCAGRARGHAELPRRP